MAQRVGSAAPTYTLVDHLGSTRYTLDGSGSKTAEMRYYPWGSTHYSSNPTDTPRRQFTGQMNDGDTGLYYYNARYYEPALARFVQADTIVPDHNNPQSLNRYAYVNNNPVKYIDPTGHYNCSSHPNDQVEQFNTCFGIFIDGFSDAEIDLIIEALKEYSNFLGGEQAFFDNILPNLTRITKDMSLLNNAYYNKDKESNNSVVPTIGMGVNYIHPLDKGVFNGKSLKITIFSMSREYNGHPGANLSQANYFKYVLAHELTHVLQKTLGDNLIDSFKSSFYEPTYDLFWGITSPFPTGTRPRTNDGLAVQNALRTDSAKELMADAVAAYIYQVNGLSDSNYDAWLEGDFRKLLK